MNNFVSVFEELTKLYESDDFEAEIPAEEVPEEEIPVEDIPADETVADDVPKQLALECAKCGAIILKNEEDVKIDDETDLANVDDSCAFCEEAEGFKVVGAVIPYEGIVVTDDEADDAAADVDVALTEGKIADSIKKVATRVGADAATILRCFAELGDNITRRDTKFYDFAEYIENKAVLKALMSGNEKVLNTLTKEDIEELKDDIAAYEKAKADKKAGKKDSDEDLEELLDVNLDLDARGFGGKGNDVSVL